MYACVCYNFIAVTQIHYCETATPTILLMKDFECACYSYLLLMSKN